MAKSVLQTVLEAADYEVRGYSGRGMCGKECLAVVTGQTPGELFAGVLRGLAETAEDIEGLADSVERMRSDSMGHDAVYYFPGTEYTDEDEDEEPLEGDDPMEEDLSLRDD